MGGLELDLPTALELIGEFGKIDGSVGWTVMIGSGKWTFWPPLLPRGDLRAGLPKWARHILLPAQPNLSGRPRQAAGGWLVNGRWPFRHWLSTCRMDIRNFCVMKAAGFPLPGSAGHRRTSAGPRLSSCRHATGISRILGMPQDLRAREAIISHLGTCGYRPQISSTSGAEIPCVAGPLLSSRTAATSAVSRDHLSGYR